MAKFRISTFKVFLIYVGVLLSFFIYAGISGTRILGDDKDEFRPDGPHDRSHSNTYRGNRFYHK